MVGYGVRGAKGGRAGKPCDMQPRATGALDLSRHHGHSPIRIEFKGAAGSDAALGVTATGVGIGTLFKNDVGLQEMAGRRSP